MHVVVHIFSHNFIFHNLLSSLNPFTVMDGEFLQSVLSDIIFILAMVKWNFVIKKLLVTY
jgi:hypothetical protein